MGPQFDNKGLKILYYILFFGTGIAAGAALGGYKYGKVSLAALIAVGTVLVLFVLFNYGWNYYWKKENPSVIEDEASETRIDTYEAKAGRTPKRLFLALLTVLILFISWGWAWSQHVFDGVFFMDKPFSTYIGVTFLSLGMLLAAFFPFLQNENSFKNVVHLNLAIDRRLITALFVALGLLSYTFLKDNPDGTPWFTVIILLLIFIWINFFIYYQDRIRNLHDKDAASETGKNHDIPDLPVSRTMVGTIIEIVVFIILGVAWYIKLSVEGLSFSNVFQSPLTTLVFTLITIGWLVVAYHPMWFFSKIREIVTVKQIRSFVNAQRCWAVTFALFTLLSSLHDYMHYEESNRWIAIATLVLFGLVGWFFGGIDKHKDKKEK